MITIYHNPRCRKSREGLEVLKSSGKAFKIIEYLKHPISEEELKAVIEKLQIEPMDLVRTNEAIWKSNYKGKPLTDQQIISALLQHPKLIERPVIVNGNRAVIGRPSQTIQDLL